jgi:hypothetical protein
MVVIRLRKTTTGKSIALNGAETNITFNNLKSDDHMNHDPMVLSAMKITAHDQLLL